MEKERGKQMPLVKSTGNMYSWVTHMHSHLQGKCPHQCTYCYVQKMRFNSDKYKGDLRLNDQEFKVDYGTDKTIFIEHMNDLFAEQVPTEYITAIIEHCLKYPYNLFVFQSKNPKRMAHNLLGIMNSLCGATIETNRDTSLFSNAPKPADRVKGMMKFVKNGKSTFVTIEPIMKFDLKPFVKMLVDIHPEFINIGADSKHNNLPEPSAQEITDLIRAINDNGLKIKIKSNLSRILQNAS